MPFGNRSFGEVEPTSFFVGHPHNSLSFLIGNTLAQAYSTGQQRGMVLLQQGYPYDLRNVQTDLANNRGFLTTGATTRVGVARGWARIPREVTHLVCDAVFAVQSASAFQVQHRLICRNGTGCDRVDYTLDYSRYEDRPNVGFFGNTPVALRPRAIAADFPYLGVLDVRYQSFLLELANVTSPADVCQIRVEAVANRSDDGSTYDTPVPYLPLWYQVSGELRY